MDKKKIISSLALAGILTASVLGTNVNAAAANEYLKPVGVYKQLIEGRTIVPYILNDANQGSELKVKDVKAEFTNLQLVNGSAVVDENATLKTGDTFKADGVEYTVVVYGDVDSTDGKVTTFDALMAQKMAMDAATPEPNAFQKEAADVVNDGNVTTLDALRIQKFALNKAMDNGESFVNPLPAAEAPEEEDSIYTVSVNDNGYINTENVGSTALKINIAETFDEAKTLSVKVTGIEEATKAEKTETKSITIPAHTDYVETDKLTTSVTFDFSSYADGMVKFEVLDGKEVVATANAEKNTVVPAAANVKTDRTSTKSATLSLEACGDSDITKVYYLVDTTQPDSEDKLVNTIDVTENKVSNVTITNDLTTNAASKVWYVLENSYGSKSEMASAVITKDDDTVTTPEAVKEVVAPDLSKSTAAEFTWTGVDGTAYVATLYKDGKPVAVATNGNGIENTDTAFKATFTNSMKEAGTYKVEVYQEATEDTEASAPTTSAEVKVEKLAAVTDLQFRNENEKVMLSWKNTNAAGSFAGYNIQLYTIDKDGKEVIDDKVTLSDITKTEVEVTSNIDNNVIYIAKVTVNADGASQMAMINSDEVTSAQFYKVGTPTIDSAETSEHEITLNVTGVEINGKTTTYKVKVFDVNSDPEVADLVLKATKDVEVKDGKIVIDGLESNKPYSFKLIAIVDGEEVESDYTATTIEDAVYTLPELKNLTKVATEEEAKEAGKVYSVDDDTIKIAGEKEGELVTIDVADYNNSAKLANSLKVINTLKPGDVVTIEDNKITLKLDGGASAADQSRDFSGLTGLKDVVFDIESNVYSKTIKTPSSGVKEVILRGTDSIFNIEGVNAEKTTLTDGVEVTATSTKTVTVSANSTVIINGAAVSTVVETEITTGTNELTVTANTEANDLVFENKKDTDLTIKFAGLPNNTSTQAGSIVIKSNGGIVTVSSDKANVSADLTIEVNKGTVDIQEPSLNGDKNVTVSLEEGETSTIKAVANTVAPVALDEVSVDITDEDLLKETGVNEDNLEAVRNFLDSFGLNGTGAKVTATADSDKVTIAFEATEENVIDKVEINNLQ